MGRNAGHVVVNTITLHDLGDGRTRLVSTSLFHTSGERDGMLKSGMEAGMNRARRRSIMF